MVPFKVGPSGPRCILRLMHEVRLGYGVGVVGAIGVGVGVGIYLYFFKSSKCKLIFVCEFLQVL